MNNIEKIQEFLVKNPGHMKRGCQNIADRLHCTYNEVKEAKRTLKIDKVSIKNEEIPQIPNAVHLPKVLILDIETAPLKAFVWRLWKQDVYIDQIISEWFMLTYSAKWLNHKEIISDRLTPQEATREDDKRLIGGLWTLLDEADIVVAHNGDSFDIPKIKTRFILHGLPPTTPYKQIDTKRIASKEFGFSSNKLDFLAQSFGFGNKIHTEFSLWSECLKGNENALIEMEEYNRKDVVLLEKIYLKLRPYVKGHPNLTLYDGTHDMMCPLCGGTSLHKDEFYYTNLNKYQVFRCNTCGGLSRSRKAVSSNKSQLMNICK